MRPCFLGPRWAWRVSSSEVRTGLLMWASASAQSPGMFLAQVTTAPWSECLDAGFFWEPPTPAFHAVTIVRRGVG